MKSICFSPRKLPPHPHSHHPSQSRDGFADSVMDHALEQAEPTITKWNLEATSSSLRRATSLFYENRHEALHFVKTVHALQRAMHLCVQQNCSSEKLIRAQDLMQTAMKRLQKEFYQILSMERAHLDPQSVSSRTSRTSTGSSASGSDDDDVSEGEVSEVEDVLADLRLIAECMISSGYGKECVMIYKIIRKSVVDEGVYRLGVERFGSASQVRKMNWEAAEVRVRNWLGALRTAVGALFSGERYLCDRVFASSDAIRESCFADVTREAADVLFGFPEDVVKNDKKSAEKVFRALDMYGAIVDHWPEIDSIFSFESTAGSKRRALASLDKLGEYARSALTEYESAILKDSSRAPVAGAGVHHLTIDAMHYLCSLSDYSAVLSDILADPLPPAKKGSSPEPYNSDSGEFRAPAVSGKLAWLILVLLCKLDSKAKQYKDVALSYLFLANNLQYVVAGVCSSSLKYLLGNEWVRKHESKVKLFASSYERLGWCHVIDSLPSDPCTVRSPREAREVFQRFNSAFDRAHEKNAACVVPDNNLRDDIKVSLAKKVLMLYRGFYEKQHRIARSKERNLACVVRYTPDDVAQCLSDLFCRDGQR